MFERYQWKHYLEAAIGSGAGEALQSQDRSVGLLREDGSWGERCQLEQEEEW
jgi:hypothetical protein